MIDKWNSLPPVEFSKLETREDWLINPAPFKASVCRGKREGEIVISNGLVQRAFLIEPNVATIALDNLVTGETLLRGIKPEARVSIDGTGYDVGGLVGQVEYAYLKKEWLDDLTSDQDAFTVFDFDTGEIKARFPWKRTRHCKDLPWPPAGKVVMFKFKPPANSSLNPNIEVNVHYEIYDGIPLISKWITVENKSRSSIHLDSFTSEILAVVDVKPGSAGGMVGGTSTWPHVYFESDFSFRGMTAEQANQVVHWVTDPQYKSQVAFLDNDKILMEASLKIGPGIDVPPRPGENPERAPNILEGLVPWAEEASWEPPAWRFESFRLFELVMDSDSRQRRGISICRMYKKIAPWVTENPIMLHLISFDPAIIENAIKQMEDVGFEMLIFSFGSNFNSSVLELAVEHPEWFDEMLKEIKVDFIDMIKAKGFDVGGYSLLASRKISIEDDVVNPYTGKTSDVNSPELEPGIEAIQGFDGNIQGAPTFGNSPCLASNWGRRYFESLYRAFKELELTILEHDGSYPGDVCASTKHPGHKGLDDSLWIQWKIITSFYKWCRSQGIFLNVPDWYMLTGSNKTGIGYKEVNWSLPRERQVMLGRQNIYDGTWEKLPTMGWTFCPLTQYHSVEEYPAEVATIEPLHEHLDHYESMLVQNLGSGVQACYRGLRLYDTGETRELVSKWVSWYKKYRLILDSEIIHVHRPDGNHVDGILHVDPDGTCDGIKGMAIFYNPTGKMITREICLNLYYTGLSDVATVAEKDGRGVERQIDREYNITLAVGIPPGKATWFTIR
ncbi:MAG: alpha-galactosidase [Promethearchaeota archaeon]